MMSQSSQKWQGQPTDKILVPTVLASAANGVTESIVKYGGDVDRIFGRATIDTDQIDNPLNELSLRHYCCLFEESAQQTHCGNFGLRFGHRFIPARLGAIGYIFINSPTMASGLRNLIRLFPAHQDNTLLALEQDDDLIWLSYQITDPKITRRRQDAELSLGMFCNLFRHVYGAAWSPLEVKFEHGKPEESHEHLSKFNCHVSFGERTNAIGFRRQCLDKVVNGHDPYLFAVFESLLEQRTHSRKKPDDFIQAVRHHIKSQFGRHNVTLNSVSDYLGIPPWSLQQKLKSYGVCFHDLHKAVRQELAIHYIRDTDMPLYIVAMELGYSELSAFSRAFSQWTGMSPQRYRRKSQK